eukprot:SAG11_NODE_9207_length_933_cov_1.155875_1_plen_112_part_00
MDYRWCQSDTNLTTMTPKREPMLPHNVLGTARFTQQSTCMFMVSVSKGLDIVHNGRHVEDGLQMSKAWAVPQSRYYLSLVLQLAHPDRLIGTRVMEFTMRVYLILFHDLQV